MKLALHLHLYRIRNDIAAACLIGTNEGVTAVWSSTSSPLTSGWSMPATSRRVSRMASAARPTLPE